MTDDAIIQGRPLTCQHCSAHIPKALPDGQWDRNRVVDVICPACGRFAFALRCVRANDGGWFGIVEEVHSRMAATH